MFFESLMILSGGKNLNKGRANNKDEDILLIEIYYIENSEFIKILNFTRYRHKEFLRGKN